MKHKPSLPPSAQEIAETHADRLIAGLGQLSVLNGYDRCTDRKFMSSMFLSAITAAVAQHREWNQLVELQLNNLRTLYDELNEAVVGYLEMRLDYQELLPHLTLKNEIQSPRAASVQVAAAVAAVEQQKALELKEPDVSALDGQTQKTHYD